MTINQPYMYVPSTYAPSAPPLPSAPPQPPSASAWAPSSASASVSESWTCPICTTANTTGRSCKTCGEAAPAGGGGGGGSAPSTPIPVAVPVPYQQPQQPYQPAQQPASQPYAAAYSPTSAPQRQPQPTYNPPPPPPPPAAPPGQKLLRVKIPPGTAAGAKVRVPVPGEAGRQVEATVPPDATEFFYVAYAPQGPPPAAPSVYASAAPAVAPSSSACATAPAPAPSVYANPSAPRAKLQVFEDRKYVATGRVTLVLRERAFSYSGDSFSIKDTTGRPWFEVKGRAFSLREKKVLHDADGGGPIWVMKEGFDFGPDRQYVYDPRENVKGRHLFVIQPKFTFLKAKMYATVRNRADGRQVQVVLKGVPTQRQAGIFIGEPKQGGERIGTIQRRLTGSDFFFDRQTYVLTIEPGVDVALMVALTIAFDELANDDR